ncbi:MBL fold metallo-hydrolase [Sphingomonas sp. Leaf10]|uniref:MBL fold metallo-hydrolase n=1 Tax=Sphingomonas sp. Leaf10 TaxID=1735676 RepID=UPI0006F9E23A|nr:MBL fold metallo-hydrolase [Sphingomonas sp. Leaf10]KQM30457.1 hypothetical protein ASE59_07700 [Sphingomonas sp. Leaf10]
MATRSDTSEAAVEGDARARGTYHFLDVGGVKYGECVLVVFGNKRILIDGSHQQDYRGQDGYRSIPQQLSDVLGEAAPHDIDLIVVTHGHADHVGCLPELFENGIIRPSFAYVTHPKAGFGRAMDESASDDGGSATRKLEAALREEDASDLSDAELAAFIDAAETVEKRYNRFLLALAEGGVEVHLHMGGPLPDAIEKRLSGTGVALLGPSEEQLLFCAEQIAKSNREAQDAIAANDVRDTTEVVALYRALTSARPGDAGYTRGNAMNCQSIVLAFGPESNRVLLAGDMQFAEPGVRKIEEAVSRLRADVVAAGPYAMFKTTHHTSHNGQDESLLDELGKPRIIVHSGGLRDEAHPYPSVLEALEARRGRIFARTDRNGLISVTPGAAGDREVVVAKGELNDFTANVLPDETRPESEPTGPKTLAMSPPSIKTVAEVATAGPQIIIVNLPPGPIDLTVAGVDIIVRNPKDPRVARRSVTFAATTAASTTRDEGGDFAGLLFASDPDRLRLNVGRSEADAAIARIEERGGQFVSGSGDDFSDRVVAALRDGRPHRGVVIVGGYDVVQPHRVDCLDPELRRKLGGDITSDLDQFWVWSDAAFGDTDDDGLAELPVSRVPDARDARMLKAAFAAARSEVAGRFGVRNVHRPFADEIWKGMAGTGDILVSEPFRSADLDHDRLVAGNHYHMLHGELDDGTIFTGEDAEGYPVAFEVKQVPTSFSGVVFTGCCWGALIVDGSALRYVDRLPPPRVVEASIALSYLKAGAQAFIGCTGAHYSGPSVDREANFAMDLHEAFWEHFAQSGSASHALHSAKLAFAESIVRGTHLDPLSTARRLKNLAQFTCLGLGW